MNIGLIGSVAMSLWTPLERSPSDLDVVCTYDDLQAFVKALRASGERVLRQYPIDSGKKVFIQTDKTIIEAEIAWEGSSAESLLRLIMSETGTGTTYAGVTLMAPRLDVLYMLKLSHRYLRNSPHFQKTRKDILAMEALGCTIRPEHMEFFKEREKATYTYAHPKLNQAKDSFFSGDGIVYEWQHDDIHEAVKHLDKPAYQYYAGGEVWSDMKVFVTLPERIKLLGVLEEALVLAAERSQLAFPDKNIDPKVSFDMALEKVASSITSGVFREFAYNNYDKVQALYDEIGYDYMERVRKGIETGVVRRTQSA